VGESENPDNLRTVPRSEVEVVPRLRWPCWIPGRTGSWWSGLWRALHTKDWEALGALLHEDVLYEDVPTPDAGARGRENAVRSTLVNLLRRVEAEGARGAD
jgi:hypothetical protein